LDNNLKGIYSAFDKDVSVNLSYNADDLTIAGVGNKNLSLKLLLDGESSTEVTHAKFNYSDKAVSFSSSSPSGIYVIESSQQTALSVGSESIPKSFSLSQNYPNPFNPTTNISFTLPTKSFVKLRIYSILGSEIKELINSNFEAGNYSIVWDGKNNEGNKVSSGIYLYKFESEYGIMTKKMNLLK